MTSQHERTPLLRRQDAKPPCFGQRHVMAILAGLGVMAFYSMRVNMSVALVAMVNSTAVFGREFQSHNLTTRSICVKDNSSLLQSHSASEGSFVWSRRTQGTILSAFYWGCLVLQIPAALMSQRFGGKWLFGFGVLWSSVLTTLIPVVAYWSPGFLIALRAAQGIGEGVVYPALNCLLGLWVPPSEASLLTTLAFEGDALGLIIGQVLSGPLCASSWGWPSSFYVCGGIGIVWFALWALMTADRPSTHRCISPDERSFIIEALGADSSEQGVGPVPWRRLLTDSGVWANFVANFALYWVLFTLLTCLPQFFSDVLHFDIATNGLVAAMPHAFCLLVSLITALLTDRAVASQCLSLTAIRKLLCLFAFSAVALSIIGITLASCNVVLVVVLLNIAVGALGLLAGGLTPNVFDLSPEFSATIESFGNSFVIVAGIAAPYLTDALTTHGLVEQWNIVFYIGAGVSMLGGVFFGIFGSAERRNWSVKAVEIDGTGKIVNVAVKG